MNKKFTILGHCNTSLGIILDSLYSANHDVEVEIVNNLSKAENRFEDMPYLHNKIQTKELHIDDWEPKEKDQFI